MLFSTPNTPNWPTITNLFLIVYIILTNSVLTFGLFINMVALVEVLAGYSSQAVKTLLVDVVLMAIANVLIFSIWYWVIDPPGVEETTREDAPWDFLFPQRAATLPHYEQWAPRYTDYLYVAFTTSYAFSPTDTMPLHPTRQAVDAPAGGDLDRHPDRDRRQRDQYPGWPCVKNRFGG